MNGMTWSRWGEGLRGLEWFEMNFRSVEYWFEIRDNRWEEAIALGLVKEK